MNNICAFDISYTIFHYFYSINIFVIYLILYVINNPGTPLTLPAPIIMLFSTIIPGLLLPTFSYSSNHLLHILIIAIYALLRFRNH